MNTCLALKFNKDSIKIQPNLFVHNSFLPSLIKKVGNAQIVSLYIRSAYQHKQHEKLILIV